MHVSSACSPLVHLLCRLWYQCLFHSTSVFMSPFHVQCWWLVIHCPGLCNLLSVQFLLRHPYHEHNDLMHIIHSAHAFLSGIPWFGQCNTLSLDFLLMMCPFSLIPSTVLISATVATLRYILHCCMYFKWNFPCIAISIRYFVLCFLFNLITLFNLKEYLPLKVVKLIHFSNVIKYCY